MAGVGLLALACSGQTTTSPSNGEAGSAGSGASGGSGGSGGTGGSSCPEDLAVRNGPGCEAVVPGCTSGACFYADGTWACAPACPCADGSVCVAVGNRNGCVPASLGGCFGPPDAGPGGAGGNGGTGLGGAGGTGLGGYGGTGAGGSGGTGTGGSGGTGTGGSGGTGTGGMGGTGGGGPCDGDPACYGDEASFCSADDTRLLECKPGDQCPAVTERVSLCSGCLCHMVPPINGVLRGTCDTCTSNAECTGNLECKDNPLFPGSGAKTCVAP